MGEDQAAAKKEAREKAEEKKKKAVKKGKKAHKNKKTSQKYKFYSASGEKKGKFCPRCGPGVFLGNMGNRQYCGKCGYTSFESMKKD